MFQNDGHVNRDVYIFKGYVVGEPACGKKACFRRQPKTKPPTWFVSTYDFGVHLY